MTVSLGFLFLQKVEGSLYSRHLNCIELVLLTSHQVSWGMKVCTQEDGSGARQCQIEQGYVPKTNFRRVSLSSIAEGQPPAPDMVLCHPPLK